MLAHELAHIRRNDFLINSLQTIIEALLFYHPLAWWVSRRVRQERENCCDDLAVQASGQLTEYVSALLIVEELQDATPEYVLAASGGSTLERVRRLSGLPSRPNSVLGICLPALASIIAVATACVLMIPEQAVAIAKQKGTGEVVDKDEQPQFSFDELIIEKDANFAEMNHTLTISKNGSYEFTNEGTKKLSRGQLSGKAIKQLEKLLKKADYLNDPMPAGLDMDSDEVKSVLRSIKNSRRLYPEDPWSDRYDMPQLRSIAAGSKVPLPPRRGMGHMTCFKVKLQRDGKQVLFSRFEFEEMEPSVKAVIQFLEKIPAQQPDSDKQPQFSFDELIIEQESMWRPSNHTLTISKDGSCKMVPARTLSIPIGQFLDDTKVLRFKLSGEAIKQLEKLLAEADYLDDPLPAGLDMTSAEVKANLSLINNFHGNPWGDVYPRAELRLIAAGSKYRVPSDQTWLRIKLKRNGKETFFSRYTAEKMKPAIRSVTDFFEEIQAQESFYKMLTQGKPTDELMYFNLTLEHALGKRDLKQGSHMPLDFHRCLPKLKEFAAGKDEKLATRAQLAIHLIKQLPDYKKDEAFLLKEPIERTRLASFQGFRVATMDDSAKWSYLNIDPDGWFEFAVLGPPARGEQLTEYHKHVGRLSQKELDTLDQLLIASNYFRDKAGANNDESSTGTPWYKIRTTHESFQRSVICRGQKQEKTYAKLLDFLKPLIARQQSKVDTTKKAD